MASLTMMNPKGAMVPEESSVYSTPSHQPTANLDKSQLSPRRVNSPKDNLFPPNNTSHQSQVHSQHKQFHATSADDQLTGCHRGSKVNSASQVKLWLQPNRTSNPTSLSAEVKNTHRFIPYFNPIKQLQTMTNSSEPLSDKASKSRKRTIVLKPKCPKYAGLSNFVAPVELASDMMPCNNFSTDNSQKQNSPSLKSVSSLTTDKMSWESNTNTDSTNTTEGHPTNEENSQTPVDFLKFLDFEEWDRRKQDLAQMVEDRKQLFLKNGFAETSGKPFQPDEQAIEKKPIPNRWVWYMHLSTDYDKIKNTRVPPGGPAGYLKYGWDRLGPAGKQPYQELADIYSAQRLKFMAAHGITEESAKKKPKNAEKIKTPRPSPHELMMRAERNHPTAGFINEALRLNGKMTMNESGNVSNQRPNFHIDMPFVPIQPILQYNLLYQQLNPFVHEKINWNYSNNSPGEIFEMNEANSYPGYLRSPEISPDYCSPFYNESGYGSNMSPDTIQQLGTPMGLPSSPSEYSFPCNPMLPCQPPSDFQSRYTLSPESIHSAHSDMSGIVSNSCIDNCTGINSTFGSLSTSNSFCEPFVDHHHDIDFPALNPININS